MNSEGNWIFLAYVLCITALGLFGHTFGVVSSFRKSMATMGPMHIFRCLFIFDLILLLILSEYLFYKIFLVDVKIMSSWACRLLRYESFQANSISSLMHVYITLERFLSMKYPVESNLLKKRTTQLIFIFVSIGISSVFYLPIYFHHEVLSIQIVENGVTFNKTLCYFADNQSKKIISIFAFINRIFLPVILFISFSFLLVCKIKTARSRVYMLYSPREILMFKKDVKLSILSIISNTLSIFLTLPVILVVFIFKYSSVAYFYAYNAFFLANVVNFYLYFVAYLIFRKKKPPNDPN